MVRSKGLKATLRSSLSRHALGFRVDARLFHLTIPLCPFSPHSHLVQILLAHHLLNTFDAHTRLITSIVASKQPPTIRAKIS